ncbi:DUF6907 domain-containing protein [Streptomyces galilaeus]|uniref:DUF6907 domain-containing protein n=1 Tax=Streptomyces galilaeus TaxID=33899 RepID=UPI0038F7FFC1
MNRVAAASTATSLLTAQLNDLSIVPAIVNGVQVPVACPAAWCKWEHDGDDATKHLEDIDHSSADVDLMVPSMATGNDELCAYVHIGQDLYSPDEQMRAPHLRLEDGGGEATYLTLDQGLEFADRLVAFAEKVRALTRVARGDTADRPAVHADAAQILGQCLQRRPGRDPLTGDRLDGQPEPDALERDRLPCIEDTGHEGDHRDCLRRTWPKAAQA